MPVHGHRRRGSAEPASGLVDKGKPRATWGRKATGLAPPVSRVAETTGRWRMRVSPAGRRALLVARDLLAVLALAIAGLAAIRPV